jgi:hypothetical protein
MMSRARQVLAAAVGVAFLGIGVGCGKSPVSPTDMSGFETEGPSIAVLPLGSVAGPTAAGEGRVRLSSVTNDPVTITVQQVPSVSATVNLGETAVISGLPPGAYTLVFTQNGSVIGTQNVVGVQPGEQVQITVVFEGGSFVMVVVIIGTLPTPAPAPQPCTIEGHSVGSSLEIEGEVVSGDRDAFRLNRRGDQGARDLYDVDASRASLNCVGQAKGSCPAGLQAGAQVHVKGTLLGCFPSSVAFTADEVKVQKP